MSKPTQELTKQEQKLLDELFKYVDGNDGTEEKMLDYIEQTYPEEVVKKWRGLMLGLVH